MADRKSNEAGPAEDLWGRTFLSNAVTESDQDRPLVPGTRLRLTFADGTLRAEAGCNLLTGRADIDGGRITVDRFASTRMACDPPRQEQDAWLARFLSADPTWRLDGDNLILSAGDTEIGLTDRRIADPDRPLRGTRWVVDSIIDNESAASVPAGAEAYLTFRDGDRVEGFTGCNRFGGTAAERGDQITFSEIASTMMACADEIGQLESAVLAVLDGQVTAHIDADKLTLSHPDGRALQFLAT